MAQVSEDVRPVVMAIFAEDCGVCAAMKRDPLENWEAIKQALIATGRFRVDQTTLRAMLTPVGPEWPKDLNRYHKFYPAILLLNGQHWNAAMVNKDLQVSGTVYGATLDPTGKNIIGDKTRPYPRTRKAILDWALAATGGPLTPAEVAAQRPREAATARPGQATAGGSEVNINGFNSVQDIVRGDQFCTNKPEVYPVNWQAWG